MMNRRQLLRGVGFVVWVTSAVVATRAIWLTSRTSASAGTVSLGQYLAGPSERPLVIDPAGQLRIGDPVFAQDSAGDWNQIGFVAKRLDSETTEAASTSTAATSATVELSWYASELDPSHCELIQYHNRGRLEDLVRLLLPPEKRQRIQQRLAAAFQEHGEAIAAAVVPLVEQSLRDSLPLIETEFRRSVDRHRDEIEVVAARLNRNLVQKRLVPLAQEEILPIVRRHAEEPAESIGRELWDRASVWRFGWRVVYDSSPLPRKDLVQQEWRRFVEQEVTEVLEQHADQLTVAVQRIVADIAADPEIRREFAASADWVASDPQTRQLVQTMLRESIVDNRGLHARWREIWTSDQAVQAMAIAGERLEPTVRSIGDDLFGTRATGIDPDFARVLRHQVLGKDRRWIIARPTGRATGNVIRFSREPMPFPVVHLAQSPAGAGE